MHAEVIYLGVGGVKRRYVLYRPPRLARCPAVVLMLDGRGGTPWTAMKSTGWSRKADAEGFLAVYPEALRLDPDGPQHFLTNPQMWNAGAGGAVAERAGVDDAGFLRAVIRDVCARCAADEQRIFMTGFSNGAAMTFRMAAEFPGVINAIAPVSGPCCIRGVRLSRPVPTIFLCGKLDPLSPFEGGEVRLPWGVTEVRPSAAESVRAWADVIGAPLAPAVELREGLVIERYGEHLAFYAIEDLGHVWPGGHRLLPEKIVGASSNRINGTDVIWSFFTGASAH